MYSSVIQLHPFQQFILVFVASQRKRDGIVEKDVGLAAPEGERKRPRWKKRSFGLVLLGSGVWDVRNKSKKRRRRWVVWDERECLTTKLVVPILLYFGE